MMDTNEKTMNDFGVNLTGKRVVFKGRQFFKANATVDERTFVCKSGPGCIAELEQSYGSFTRPHGYRTIVAESLDGTPEVISSYDIEAYINRAGTLVRLPEETDSNMVEVLPKLILPQKLAVPLPVAIETGEPFQEVATPAYVPPPPQNVKPASQNNKPAKKSDADSTPPPTVAAPANADDLQAAYQNAVAKRLAKGENNCKNGHPVSFENANKSDLRRNGKYCCQPCIELYRTRKLAPAQ